MVFFRRLCIVANSGWAIGYEVECEEVCPFLSHFGIVFLILSEGFVLAYVGVFWTLPPLFLSKESVGSGMGLINALGNLGVLRAIPGRISSVAQGRVSPVS